MSFKVVGIMVIVGGTIIIAVCILIINKTPVTVPEGPEILGTAILFRHGEKTPMIPIGKIPCGICDDLGFGQLTRNGAKKLLDEGKYLLHKYLSLFPEDGLFRQSNMKISSSSSYRCTMSLQNLMAGFMSDSKIGWQAIAYEVDSSDMLLSINASPDSCLKYWEEYDKELPNSDLGRAMMKDKEAFDKLAIMLNTSIERPMDLGGSLDGIRILLDLEETKHGVPKELSELYTSTFTNYLKMIFRAMGSNSRMLKFRTGILLSEIVNNFQSLATGEKSARKFLIYSGHDINIYCLAIALGVEDQLPEHVDYGDSLMFDLIRAGEDKETRVQLVYFSMRDGSYLQYPLQIIGQQDSCLLSEFVDQLSHLLTTESELVKYCDS